ncbi:hypothetical protein [Agrococcus jejuensis]|uniref:Multidrug ABC transporter ATPase n=1 Tax=Agrococcus jejuensis TaxID=399736 RepID=A0A1G8B9Q7_9MICO|nr:hypothetical protein [Agrococcus jejuensis]SDH29979.1 hypothetical protein SAMN04489720_0782 [Agrococcus jejuensis]
MPTTRAGEHHADPIGVIERILATAAAVLVGVALLGFVLTLVQIGLRDTWPWLADGVWPYAFLVPTFALPAGLLCVIALLVLSAVRKGRGRA